MKLFCFAHAGGTAASFGGLARRVRGCSLVPVERPGHGFRAKEALMASIQDYARDALDQIAGQLDGPFGLMGHSMGAWVAYEVATLLSSGHLPDPSVLVVSGNVVPAGTCGAASENLDDDAFLDSMSGYVSMPAEVLHRPELREVFFTPLRSDFVVVQRYSRAHHQILECPIVALFGADDPLTCGQGHEWSRLTTRQYEEHIFRGGHFFLFEDADVPKVLTQLVDRSTVLSHGTEEELWNR